MNIVHSAIKCAILQDRFESRRGGGHMEVKEGEGNAGTADRNESVRVTKALADAEANLKQLHKDIAGFIEKASGEMKEQGKVSLETNKAVATLLESQKETCTRIDQLEAKYNRRPEGMPAQESPGALLAASDDYKHIGQPGRSKAARIQVKTLLGNMETKAVVNATGQNQPLVPDMRVPGIIMPTMRRLTVRDLIPVGRTNSNLVQFTTETLFTNNAGPQVAGSPTAASENATKPESDLTFALSNAPVVTIAHFVLASKQVLEDAPMLQSYIDGRLMYGLKLEEEDELLNGDGSAGTINGLFSQAAAYNRALTGTKLDVLRRVQTQILIQEMEAEFYVLNPQDWEEIELTKDSQGRYVLARPEALAPPQIWGRPVVPTNSITAGYFFGGNGSQAAWIWDREDAGVEVSREDGNNFQKNMVTILCEERLALTVYRSAALVRGQFA